MLFTLLLFLLLLLLLLLLHQVSLGGHGCSSEGDPA
jgi:hypothetical protein